jgi:hypothetical protein
MWSSVPLSRDVTANMCHRRVDSKIIVVLEMLMSCGRRLRFPVTLDMKAHGPFRPSEPANKGVLPLNTTVPPPFASTH